MKGFWEKGGYLLKICEGKVSYPGLQSSLEEKDKVSIEINLSASFFSDISKAMSEDGSRMRITIPPECTQGLSMAVKVKSNCNTEEGNSVDELDCSVNDWGLD